jgi:hypothetical protein
VTRKTRDQHLFSSGPKRILALDGGGIRGILTLQVLRRIEDILRARAGGDPEFRLCDYFDLIGGTSTGSIIAAGLSIGMSIDDLEKMYKSLGNSIFKSGFLRFGVVRAKFAKEPLEKALKEVFTDITVGDAARVHTGLAVMLKRIDSGSPWIVHNNPRGKYFAPRPGGQAIPNREFPLWQIVRSSSAAPHYFDPELFPVARNADGTEKKGAFVDGGVSPHNNPALQLVMLAWLQGHGLQWPAGDKQLLVVSLGTGSSDFDFEAQEAYDKPSAKLALESLGSLMDDVRSLNETMLQWMSASPTARRIDREVGNLSADFLGGTGPLLSYLRYDAWLEQDWLGRHGLPGYDKAKLDNIKEMDKPENIDELIGIGKALARDVEESHFPAHFDVT